ncbi:hypothetical protein BDV09DRAFT_181813 [Aspergillus tetrazonus]
MQRINNPLCHEYDFVQAIERATDGENRRRSSQNTIKRTREIMEAAKWCSKNENNEEKWRLEVEATVFSRLVKHHVCSKCEKRLWKADVEFPIGDEDGKRWEDLRRRRQNRDTCVCTMRDLEDPQGKDRVFESLQGSYVRYEPDLAPKVPTGIRPDLVVGLANNPKWTTILGAPCKYDPDKKVGEVVKSDIFANMGNAASMNEGSGMIFPFLVLEAKRASAPDSLESIARQMALPAYEMLRMQSWLLGDSAASQFGGRLPRVWLVSFKGQCWRLYVGTAEKEENGEYVYNIYDMWDGDITRISNALKLVLLLDGIFDWALDIYRLDIFESLELMVSRGWVNSTNLTPTMSILSDQLEKMTINPSPNSNLGNLDTVRENILNVIKYKGGWVRDGRRLLISAEGLLLTSSNVAEIFDNFEHPDHAKRFARLIWTLLSRNAWVFREKDILNKVREVWTGETRNKQQLSETPIFMQLEVYDFFDIHWQLRRGLIFVAATKDSISEIFNRAQYLIRHPDEIETKQQEINQQEFLSKLRTERQRDTVSGLEDALSRWHCRLSRHPNGNVSWVPVSVPSCDKLFQEIFRMYQAGKRDPSESFLHIWRGKYTIQSESRPLKSTDQVLVVGDTDKRDWAGVIPRNRAPSLCLFVYEDLDIIEGLGVEQELLFRLVQKDYYYTVRRGRYFSGSTHYDDNRPENRIIHAPGAKVARGRNSIGPSSRSLVDEWIRRLADDELNDSDSDEEGYDTDDNDDHRGRGLFVRHELAQCEGEEGKEGDSGRDEQERNDSSDQDEAGHAWTQLLGLANTWLGQRIGLGRP